ncbi:ABC transporter permease [Bacteroidota bacterium]
MAKIYHRIVRPNQPISDWLKQLWLRRETLYFFVWRDLKVQFQSPILGILWSILQPLIYFGIILSVIKLSGRNGFIDSLPLPVYLISGLAIWNFVTSTITATITGLQSNASIISKASFPRFYLILSPLIRGMIDLLPVLLIVVGIALFNGRPPNLNALYLLPICVFILLASTAGISALALSALVYNRHLKHIVPILLYAGLFLLPVFYSCSENEIVAKCCIINPIAGSMSLLRNCFTTPAVLPLNVMVWILISSTLLVVGMLAFKKVEKTLADNI